MGVERIRSEGCRPRRSTPTLALPLAPLARGRVGAHGDAAMLFTFHMNQALFERSC